MCLYKGGIHRVVNVRLLKSFSVMDHLEVNIVRISQTVSFLVPALSIYLFSYI